MSELYHHGVKGMKWGVRRYQNPDGSLTAKGKQRLATYKKMELKRLNRTYNIKKLDRKRTKLEEKYGSSDDPKKQQKITAAKYTQLKAEGMKYLESKAIRNMTFKDMKAEQVAVGKARVKSIVNGVMGATLLSALSGGRALVITSLPDKKVKTQNRVSANTQLVVDREARKVTGHTGRWYY